MWEFEGPTFFSFLCILGIATQREVVCAYIRQRILRVVQQLYTSIIYAEDWFGLYDFMSKNKKLCETIKPPVVSEVLLQYGPSWATEMEGNIPFVFFYSAGSCFTSFLCCCTFPLHVSHYIPCQKKAAKDQQWGKAKYETFSESLHHFLCLTDMLPVCSLWPTDLKEFSIPWKIWKNSIRVLFCFVFHPCWWLFW